MLCERCKIREANIKYTEIVNGDKDGAQPLFPVQELDLGQSPLCLTVNFRLGVCSQGFSESEITREETDERAGWSAHLRHQL